MLKSNPIGKLSIQEPHHGFGKESIGLFIKEYDVNGNKRPGSWIIQNLDTVGDWWFYGGDDVILEETDFYVIWRNRRIDENDW